MLLSLIYFCLITARCKAWSWHFECCLIMTLAGRAASPRAHDGNAGSLGWKAALNPGVLTLLGCHSLPFSLCLANPVIYGVEVLVCFVAAVNSNVKNVLPAACSFSFSVAQETLIKCASPNHSCVKVEA